jgi:hypothetical protein
VEIKQIKQAYTFINSSKLKSNSYKYSNKCGVVNACITLYYLKGEIVKITDNGIGDDDKAAEKWNYEYYFKSGNLIFSYEWIKYYDNDLEKSVIDEKKEYFKSNKLLKKIENQKTTYPTNKTINYYDDRYLLKGIKSVKDINQIYKCLN